MKHDSCAGCGKTPLDKDEIGITKKLLGKNVQTLYCLPCLALFLEVEEQDILDKSEVFKEEGCRLFN